MDGKRPWYTHLAHFFGGKPNRTEVELIEEQIEEELAALVGGKVQTRKFTPEENIRFCRLISDENPIHRDEEAARAYKFMKLEDRAIVGPLLVGNAQRVAEETFDSISNYWGLEPGSNFVVGTKTQFKTPAYPGKELEFKVVECAETASGIDLSVRIGVGSDTIALADVSFAGTYRQNPGIAGPIFSESYEVTGQVVDEVNKILGYPEGRGMSPLVPSLFTPSTLLYLLQARTGSMIGGNLKMETSYLGKPALDEVQVDIFPPRKKAQSNRFNLSALASVGTVPIAYTSISCVTPEQVALRKTPRKIDLS